MSDNNTEAPVQKIEVPVETFVIDDWQVGTSQTEKNPGRRFVKSKTIDNFFFWIDEWQNGAPNKTSDQTRADILYSYNRAKKTHERQKHDALQAFYAANGYPQ